MKLKTLGLLGALVFAVPAAAIAAPTGGLTAEGASSAMATPALETNAAVDSSGPIAKVEKVWWRGGWGGYGWRRGGFGWRGGWGGYGWRGGWGWRRGWGGYGWRGGWGRRW